LADIPHLESIFQDICLIAVDDGIEFQADSVRGAEIRKEANYAGIRLMLLAVLDSARCSVQIDIGFGDAVVPVPDEVQYPVILAKRSDFDGCILAEAVAATFCYPC
jgi:hypothetical protein